MVLPKPHPVDVFRAECYSPCALGNLLKSRTKQALALSAVGLRVWLTRCSPSVCLRPWETGWCHRSDGPIPFISVRTGAWLMDRKYSRRNNNICRIYFSNIRPLSLRVLISAHRNPDLWPCLSVRSGRCCSNLDLRRANTRTLLDYLDPRWNASRSGLDLLWK